MKTTLNAQWFLAGLVSMVFAFSAQSFSLLGPYADWMQETNGFRGPGEIGGPMGIAEGYRWNVPFVTYAFDKSFMDFFGTQGVAAVESAIKIFNDLPAASAIILTNYSLTPVRVNYRAESESLTDLKSATLFLLAQHLGLAAPTRNIFVLRQWAPFLENVDSELSWPEGTIPNYVLERNFDPETLRASHYVNQNLYSANYGKIGEKAYMIPFPVDPTAFDAEVADWFSNDWVPYGRFFTGMSYDDVGALRFLLSRTNVNYENLLSDVQLDDCGRGPLVNGAWRPGIEKITFVRQSYDINSGLATPLTFNYTDTSISNGVSISQCVRRLVTNPDIIFSAEDSRLSFFERTGTSNWVNNARINGRPNGAGPGVIQPPIKLTFQKLGPMLPTEEPVSPGTTFWSYGWGSFDASTNAPIRYPIGIPAGAKGMIIHLDLYSSLEPYTIWLGGSTWQVPVSPGGTVAFQTSTNLTDWITVATTTNSGAIVRWLHAAPMSSTRFFRPALN